MSVEAYELAIIGAGPAGLTAGLYAARSRIKTVIIERYSPGGQVLSTDWVENYPGFPEGISGFDLVDKMKAQVDRFEVPHLLAEVTTVTPVSTGFNIALAEGSLNAKAVIITTGAEPTKLGVKGESVLTGRGVSYCGTCDAPFYRNQKVLAVGGGDTACEEALYLTKFADKVYLAHRRDELRAVKVLQEKVLANPKIEVLWDTVLEEIVGEDGVKSAKLKNVKTEALTELELDGVFIFVGVEPTTNFCMSLVDQDDSGFILTDDNMATSFQGIFAAGDCRSKALRQISTAVGDGAMAAFNAERYLEGLDDD